MNAKLYNVGMYLRLSRENTEYAGNDSMSIENQGAILSKFIAMMPGWVETRTYIDNGASGGNFNRQGFRDMMEDIRNGTINLVLVQDLSRFGRNYLETGKYLEEELPALGCRFVALADGVDTEDGENDIIPFLNAMNDFYLKNISDKIKSVFAAKAKAGHKLTGAAPYGYMRSFDDKTRLIVDETAAKIVRRIFEMRADGWGYGRIVNALNGENIPPPRLHYYLRQNKEPTEKCGTAWQIYIIPRILTNEIYLGHTISLQYTRSYRSGKSKRRSEDEWLKIPDTHDAIIDVDLWEKAQAVNERLSKWTANAREPQTYLFSGKIYCNGCNKPLMARSEKRGKSEIRRNSYTCRTYHSSGRRLCSRHGVNEDALKKIVLDNIKRHAEHIALDEKRIAAELYEKLAGDISVDKADVRKQLRELGQLLHSFDVKLEQLYEDKVTSVISAETFTMLAAKTEAERDEVCGKISLLEKGVNETKARLGDIQNWIGLIKENATVDDVDRVLVEALIERIEVGESVLENGVKSQEMKIFYRFVGVVGDVS